MIPSYFFHSLCVCLSRCVRTGRNFLRTGSNFLRMGSTSLHTGSTSLRTGSTSLRTGSTYLCTGSSSLRTSSTYLCTDSTSLRTGSSYLRTGSTYLRTGSTLHTSSTLLCTGSTSLLTGSTSLPTASTSLRSGSTSLRTSSTSLGGPTPRCISCANVHNYCGPYAYCSLDKGVACAQHIQLQATCAEIDNLGPMGCIRLKKKKDSWCTNTGPHVLNFFLTDSRSSKSTQDCAWEKWATPPYDTVDPRNAGHMAKTQGSHAYTRGLSDAVGKTATPYGKPIMRKS